jgi:GNAT superfamily N-acetyltransferase
MDYRWAEHTDIPNIVATLRSSLGESLLPKSVDLWHWKHVANPFGKSPVLLACDKQAIVGVRALMPWHWEHEGNTLRSLRAVDTAVIPDYQGKGIFSTLTRQLLQELDSSSYNFVFNTPNKHSLPGYLKLGWQKVGKIPVLALPVWSLGKYSGIVSSQWPEFEQVSLQATSPSDKLYTDVNMSYLSWRYRQCPIATYHPLTDGQNFWCIYRIKKRGIFKEFRIVEFGQLSPKVSSKSIILLLKQAIRQAGVQIVTASLSHGSLLQAYGLGKFYQVEGPLLTIRELSSPLAAPVLQQSAWTESLGPLEVF